MGTAVSDCVRTSLGPRGMDKMIITKDGETVITNDGATMLKHLSVMHPAARMVRLKKLLRWLFWQKRKTDCSFTFGGYSSSTFRLHKMLKLVMERHQLSFLQDHYWEQLRRCWTRAFILPLLVIFAHSVRCRKVANLRGDSYRSQNPSHPLLRRSLNSWRICPRLLIWTTERVFFELLAHLWTLRSVSVFTSTGSMQSLTSPTSVTDRLAILVNSSTYRSWRCQASSFQFKHECWSAWHSDSQESRRYNRWYGTCRWCCFEPEC